MDWNPGEDCLSISLTEGDGMAIAATGILDIMDDIFFHDPDAHWLKIEGASADAVLVMPVPQSSSEPPSLLVLAFRRPSEDVRNLAYGLLAGRRDMIGAFFRLWRSRQSDRMLGSAIVRALDALDFGVLLVDQFGRLVRANTVGAAILARGDGLSRSNNVIRANTIGDSVRLQAALAHAGVAAGRNGGGARQEAPVLLISRREAAPLVATVLPLPDGVAKGDVCAVLYLLDSKFDAPRLVGPLCRLYHLSPVETRLVCQLATGASLADAARSIRIKELTARGYLKQIFIKTGTNRQSELIALMLSSLLRVSDGIVQQSLESDDDPVAIA
jgi:DNA-binding CsgD family transcriptional regulator